MIEREALSELHQAADTLAGVDAPWCFCGGWAIDLFLDRETRPHKDIDIAIRRRDQLVFQSHLMARGWQLEIAEKGLHRWAAGHFLQLPANTIWCWHSEQFMELLFDEWDDHTFRLRHKQSISMPAKQAMVTTPSGFRALAPETVMLYKSRDAKNADYRADFENAYPNLPEDRRRWLETAMAELHGSHPWLASNPSSRSHRNIVEM